MGNPSKIPVHCGVDTCAYWSDHFCTAKKLDVNSMVTNAHTSDGTCCETFICKD